METEKYSLKQIFTCQGLVKEPNEATDRMCRGQRRRSILLLVPPLAEGTAAAIFIQRDEEDAVEFSVETGRHNNKGRPPASNSLLGSYGENFVAKLNVLLGVSDVGPIFEDGWPSAHGFEERGDLIGAVFREKVRGGLRVAAFPRAAVGIQPR
jgi:hypothetical protein